MKSLIVLHGPLSCNSGVQVFHLANGLVDQGWEVAVAVPSSTEDVHDLGDPKFECLTYAEARRAAQQWSGQDVVIHAWTPRERVRRVTEEIARSARAPYVVHLEDNEEYLASFTTKIPYAALRSLPRRAQDLLARDFRVHPTRYPRFLDRAAGVTMVTERLNEFNFAGHPHALIPPGVDTGEFAPGADRLAGRRELGLSPNDFVLVYHGNLHAVNRRDMKTLYSAVKILRRRGHPVRLVRLGHSGARLNWMLRRLRAEAEVIELGMRPRREVVGWLRTADAFVQPGACDDFNSYRFPSKIPEFLAMARPVILPACNIGGQLSDGEDALLLREGSSGEIAGRVERLLSDPQLAHSLGAGARAFACNHLERSRIARTASDFLSRVVSEWSGPVRAGPARLKEDGAGAQRKGLAKRSRETIR